LARVCFTAIIIASDSKGSLMNADTERPRFPGRELARWIGFRMRQLGKAVLHIINRIRSIPKRRRTTLLAIVGMVIFAIVVGGIVGFLLPNPILWGRVFALITIIWTVISVATANNLKLLLSRARRAGSGHAFLIEAVRRLAGRAGIPPHRILWNSSHLRTRGVRYSDNRYLTDVGT